MSKNVKVFLSIMITMVAVAAGLIFVANRAEKAKTAGTTPDNYSDLIGPNVDSSSTENFSADYIEKLAKFMTEKGMIMYGAYWCPHCQAEKQLFGAAFQFVDYVECDPQGPNANPGECSAKNVTGYPTWIYNGTTYSGQKTLSQLAQIVGFNQ